jgi:ATP-binding cassette subfamily F protein uup
LLNLIAGRLTPDRGSVSVGETVKIGYFMQDEIVLDDSLRVIDYIREEAEVIHTASGSIRASQMLERFLFPPQVQWTPISKLSGGEKRRLHLLRILMGAPNVLILDEPTNDLDIQTLTILEHYLDEFEGVVIAVSHDRFFLDRVTDKLFSFGPNGHIQQYTGSYAVYQEQRAQIAAIEEKDVRAADKKVPDKQPHSQSKGPLKFTYKEQKEYDEIDAVIASLEEQISDIDHRMQTASADFSKLQDFLAEKEGLDQKLEHAYERWVYLQERAAEIDAGKLQ